MEPQIMGSTIVGVATGSPDGGVAIVRLSGPRASSIAGSLLADGRELGPPRTLVRRAIDLGDEGHEDALVVLMPGPRSFTGEDVVELHVHGGRVNTREVVQACLAAGAQPAGPGDFSRRAFEHGRLSLAQSEGVAALIGAQTRAGAAQARRLVAGELGEQVRGVARSVAELRVEVEAYLDFPDDVNDAITVSWRGRLSTIAEHLQAWLTGFEAGRRAREVPRVVLAGAPNAGKSSLMNALLGTRRALVADRPGTTRDFVEADLFFERHALRLIDTAGLRSGSDDAVERAGIELSVEQVQGADLVLWIVPVVGSGAPPGDGPVDGLRGAELWRVGSKSDLGPAGPGFDVVVHTKDERGVAPLRRALHDWLRGAQTQPWVGLERHRDRAAQAAAAVDEARELLARDAEVELVAFALQVAQSRLEEIEGRSQLGPIGAEVLDAIFSNFCIGK